MIDLLYKMIYWVAEIHDEILTINDAGGYYFTDKQLHFLVVGATGLLMIFIVYPIFKLLAKYNHTMVIAWIYVFTLLMGVSFAVEIGQWLSGTGRMEMADVISGMAGFFVMFFIFALIRGIYHAIIGAVTRKEEAERKH